MATAIMDGNYRYLLTRELDRLTRERVLFVMLNPSTADAERDDPTIRRCKGFAASWGCRYVEVVNLYAWRATDPRALWQAEADEETDIVGPMNDRHIGAAAGRADLVVVAWGGQAYVGREPLRFGSRPRGGRASAVLSILRDAGKRPLTFGLTAGGAPRHPLYVPRGTCLIRFLGKE